MNINLMAPINSLGYGIASLNILKALAKNNDVALWPIGQAEAHPSNHAVIMDSMMKARFFDPNAPSLKIYHQNEMATRIGRGLHIGFPFFELNKFDQVETHHLRSLDHIIVASAWAKDVLQGNFIKNKYVSVAPLGVDRDIFFPAKEESWAPTRFLTVGKWEVRKGHDFIIKAFNLAFEQKDNVELIFNCHNPFLTNTQQGNMNEMWEKKCVNSKLGNKINLFSKRLETQQDVAKLMNRVDAGLFPARAEGWNLELLEMMSCGKHVIATNYSAHTEFVNKDNCHLINIDRLEDAFDGVWFHGQGEWAELEDAQLEQMVKHMSYFTTIM